MTEARKKEPYSAKRQAEISEMVLLLSEYWKKKPSLRLGQLLCNVDAFPSNDPYYTEDALVLKQLQDAVMNK